MRTRLWPPPGPLSSTALQSRRPSGASGRSSTIAGSTRSSRRRRLTGYGSACAFSTSVPRRCWAATWLRTALFPRSGLWQNLFAGRLTGSRALGCGGAPPGSGPSRSSRASLKRRSSEFRIDGATETPFWPFCAPCRLGSRTPTGPFISRFAPRRRGQELGTPPGTYGSRFPSRSLLTLLLLLAKSVRRPRAGRPRQARHRGNSPCLFATGPGPSSPRSRPSDWSP